MNKGKNPRLQRPCFKSRKQGFRPWLQLGHVLKIHPYKFKTCTCSLFLRKINFKMRQRTCTGSVYTQFNTITLKFFLSTLVQLCDTGTHYVKSEFLTIIFAHGQVMLPCALFWIPYVHFEQKKHFQQFVLKAFFCNVKRLDDPFVAQTLFLSCDTYFLILHRVRLGMANYLPYPVHHLMNLQHFLRQG